MIVCVGLTTIDHTQRVDAFPEPNKKIVAKGSTIDVGGPAANAARTARELGSQVVLVTALGNGALSKLVREFLAGIEIVDVASASFQPPISTVMVTDSGDRCVISTNNTSLDDVRLPDAEVLSGANVVLHDGHLLPVSVPLSQVPEPAHLLDGGSWKPGLEKLLPQLDVAVISADFKTPGSTPKNALDELSEYKIHSLARSDGPGKVEIRELSWDEELTPSYETNWLPVEQVRAVDTNGAGDVLHGALAHYLAEGKKFQDALEAATKVATACVQHHGVMGWTNGR